MFDPHLFLTPEDFALFQDIVPSRRFYFEREPDLTIAPDGVPYLYRWFVIPRNEKANVYFHIQVASDPERPLHDHPYKNTSVILSGGYDELINFLPPHDDVLTRKIRAGDVIYREATYAHRLILPSDIPYTMTIFSTGPRIREWGFWTKDGWVNADEMTAWENGQSVMKEKYRGG